MRNLRRGSLLDWSLAITLICALILMLGGMATDRKGSVVFGAALFLIVVGIVHVR